MKEARVGAGITPRSSMYLYAQTNVAYENRFAFVRYLYGCENDRNKAKTQNFGSLIVEGHLECPHFKGTILYPF